MDFEEIQKNKIIHSKNSSSLKLSNKYTIHNRMENPNLKFSEKEGKINMEIINSIDFNSNYFNKKNEISIQKLIDNLISAKFYKSQYDDINKYLLVISLQNSLDYLIDKKNRLSKANNLLNKSLNKIYDQENQIKEKLEQNKKIIDENSKIIEEKKILYEKNKSQLKVKNDSKKIEVKNNEFNVKTEIKKSESNKNSDLKDINDKNKYFCEICENKFFLSEKRLEIHHFKRHQHIIIQKKNKVKKNDFYLKYLKELENLKTLIYDSLRENNDLNKYNEVLEKFKKEREENQLKLEIIIKSEENAIDKMNISIKEIEEIQYNFINKLIILLGLNKSDEDIKIEQLHKKEEQEKLEKTIKENIISMKKKDLNEKLKELNKQLSDFYNGRKIQKEEISDNKIPQNESIKNNINIIANEILKNQINEINEKDKFPEKIKNKDEEILINEDDNLPIKLSKNDIKTSIKDNNEKPKNEKIKIEPKEQEKIEGKDEKIEEEKNKKIEEEKNEKIEEEKNKKIESSEEKEQEHKDINDSKKSSKETSFIIERVKRTDPGENEEMQLNEFSKFINNIFNESNINNKTSFNKRNNIKQENEGIEENEMKNIFIEIPIHSTNTIKLNKFNLNEIKKEN